MPIRRIRRPKPLLDMTPMIDCVFQLLIFFMLSSSLVSPHIRLALPRAATNDQGISPEIVLTADDQGHFFINQEPVRFEELRDRLTPLLTKAKNKIVTFRGDKKLDYEIFVKSLDAARAAGAIHMNVAHQ